MDIYILRDGKEMGPFSEVTTQTLLKQGTVVTTDLAWRPGMEEWGPLHSVLYPAPGNQAATMRPPPPPGVERPSTSVATPPVATREVAAAPAEPSLPVHPATAEQKAFLSYMGVPISEYLSEEQANQLADQAKGHVKDASRVQSWNVERFRLFPELFAAEAEAYKEQRPAMFLAAAQKHGAEIFTKLTKAHCQVLVGYLDVRFPNWDAHPERAVQQYLFPAIEEKFPKVVNSAYKDKFKYPEGKPSVPSLPKIAGVKAGPVAVAKPGVTAVPKPGVAAGPKVAAVGGAPKAAGSAVPKGGAPKVGSVSGGGGVSRSAAVQSKPNRTKLQAAFRGVIYGVVVLGLLYGGQLGVAAYQTRFGGEAPAEPLSPEGATASAPVAEKAPAVSPVKIAAAPAATPEPVPEPARPRKKRVAAAEPATPAVAPMAAEPAPMAGAPMAAAPMAAAPMAAEPAPMAAAPAAEPAPVAAAPAPASAPVAPLKTAVLLKRAMEVQLPFGRAVLPLGTQLKIVAVEGTNLQLRYGQDVILIAMADTDFADGAPAAPGAPAPAPVPAAPPAKPAGSLF